MIGRITTFLRAVSISWLGRFAVALTTAAFVTFLLMEALSSLGVVSNAYVGMLLYLLLPAAFVLGLVLIPLAWWRMQRNTGLSARQLVIQRFGQKEVEGRTLGSPLVRTVGILTLVNIVFLGAASFRALHFMDSAEFCGTACHAVMNPEWTTYQASPHARVACVECHVGEGFGALVEAKRRGAWQVISSTFDLYERPIPTPVHTLRPARETCEKCHWPEKFYGSKLKSLVRYQADAMSTPAYTTLALKIDAAGTGPSGIHWHVAQENEVRYASAGDARERMLWVEQTLPDGRVRRFENIALRGHEDIGHEVRTLDCVDCHNRATHIYEDPGKAVDERMRRGLLDRSLPFLKREAVKAITAHYADREAAMVGIENHLRGYYRRQHPELAGQRLDAIDEAVRVLRGVYERNIHHGMEIGWGAYPSQLGHDAGRGCFRCHNRDLRDADGVWISDDCTLCHSILANGEPEPFQYLRPAGEKEKGRAMHEALRQEFLDSFPH